MRGADVIGHDVQQVAHVPVGQGLPQTRQLLVASEMRVDVLVVGHVVLCDSRTT